MEEKPEGWEGHPFHLLGHAGRLVRGLVGSRTFVGLIQSCAHRSGKDLFPLLRSWQHSWVRPTSLDLCTEVGLARSPLEKEVLARLSCDAVSFVEGDGLSNEVWRRPEVPWSRRWCDLSISYGGEVVERARMFPLPGKGGLLNAVDFCDEWVATHLNDAELKVGRKPL